LREIMKSLDVTVYWKKSSVLFLIAMEH
jgi:hypothetical protein